MTLLLVIVIFIGLASTATVNISLMYPTVSQVMVPKNLDSWVSNASLRYAKAAFDPENLINVGRSIYQSPMSALEHIQCRIFALVNHKKLYRLRLIVRNVMFERGRKYVSFEAVDEEVSKMFGKRMQWFLKGFVWSFCVPDIYCYPVDLIIEDSNPECEWIHSAGQNGEILGPEWKTALTRPDKESFETYIQSLENASVLFMDPKKDYYQNPYQLGDQYYLSFKKLQEYPNSNRDGFATFANLLKCSLDTQIEFGSSIRLLDEEAIPFFLLRLDGRHFKPVAKFNLGLSTAYHKGEKWRYLDLLMLRNACECKIKRTRIYPRLLAGSLPRQPQKQASLLLQLDPMIIECILKLLRGALGGTLSDVRTTCQYLSNVPRNISKVVAASKIRMIASRIHIPYFKLTQFVTSALLTIVDSFSALEDVEQRSRKFALVLLEKYAVRNNHKQILVSTCFTLLNLDDWPKYQQTYMANSDRYLLKQAISRVFNTLKSA